MIGRRDCGGGRENSRDLEAEGLGASAFPFSLPFLPAKYEMKCRPILQPHVMGCTLAVILSPLHSRRQEAVVKFRSILSGSTLVAFTLSGVACERQPESPSSVLSADSVPIHYEVQGSGEPAFVFVHCWSCDRSYWGAQVSHFAERYRVVNLDLAGHGESGGSRATWTMAAFGADVAAVVEHLDLHDVVLIGHSIGGPVVVEAARQLGDRVIAVVGVDTFNDVSQRYPQEEIEGFLQPFREDFAEATRGFVRTAMFVPETDSALVHQIAEDMSSAPPDVAVAALEGMADWVNNQTVDAFRELNAPVYLINSDMNPTNVDAGREYTSSFEVVLMSGVGHFVMMEDPDTFNRLLSEVVESLQHN